jgi:O-antigen/teichoic acid export membrane protein
LQNEIYKKIAIYSTPFILWGAISWIQSNGERWVINGILTPFDLGRYGFASSLISSSIVVIFNVISQFITPIIFNKFSSNTEAAKKIGMRIIRLYSWITFMLFFTFGIVLFFTGNFITHLISTNEFTIDSSILFLLTVGIGIFCVAQTLTSIGLAYHKPKIYIVPKILSALLSIIAYVIGCYLAGIMGVVIAIVVVNCLYLIMIFIANKKFLSFQSMQLLEAQ